MKRIIIATAAAIISVSAASAADLKAPVYKAPVLAPAYNWTGWYVGVNAGIATGRNETSLAIPTQTSFNSFVFAPEGAIGGVQAGFNWQFGRWVLGLEADIQASGQSDSACIITCRPGVAATFVNELDWLGTVRGRLGYTNGPLLGYVTGGFAYGDVKVSVSEALAGGTFVGSFNDTLTGWTLGSGVEAALGGNWTGKLEYLYVDLGSIDGTYAVAANPHTFSTEIKSHIFRAGLNYRIGATGMLAPQPVANWTGFYVGANVGSGYGRSESSFGIPFLGVNETFTLAPTGFIGGAQAGYNWQASNWLFGVEADIQGSTQKDDDNCLLGCLTTPQTNRFEQTLPWFGTVRARLGYAVGPTLFYLTGGLAYGEVKTELTQNLGGPGVFNLKDTKVGWALGGGVERPFDLFGLLPPNNWTVKGEYLYVDLGSTTHSLISGGGLPSTFTTDSHNHIFRTGLSYHFNAGPVVAKY